VDLFSFVARVSRLMCGLPLLGTGHIIKLISRRSFRRTFRSLITVETEQHSISIINNKYDRQQLLAVMNHISDCRDIGI
jgi:hypothetical protein